MAARRRVLHLRSSGGLLGAEQVILALCAHASRFGYEPSLAVTHDAGDAQPELLTAARSRGIDTHLIECSVSFDPRAVGRLRECMRTVRPSVLHCHGYREDLYAMAARMKAHLVTTNHLWKRTTLSLRLYARVDAWLVRRFDRVVAVSREICSELERSGLRSPRLRYIPNGVELERFGNGDRQHVRRALGLAADELVVAVVGSLTEEKGHRYLLDALARLGNEGRAASLLVIGDGPEAERLEGQARRLGIESRVALLGRREDVAEILAAVDVFVLPSLVEGLPIALLEAMAAGVACVATRVGDVPQVVEEGRSGLLVPSRDSGAIAAALERLAADPALRSRLAAYGERAVRESFSSERMTERYCALYDELCEPSGVAQ